MRLTKAASLVLVCYLSKVLSQPLDKSLTSSSPNLVKRPAVPLPNENPFPGNSTVSQSNAGSLDKETGENKPVTNAKLPPARPNDNTDTANAIPVSEDGSDPQIKDNIYALPPASQASHPLHKGTLRPP
ncbi:MAG: hypothetical protein Q9215_000357 [Flavoplaca cf. flavocitrina]